MPESVNVDPNNSRRKSRIRWKWYHFYFLLALFDVVVIIMSLALYDRVLASYEVALRELGGMDIRQHWLAEMRTAVVRLNAPGNDVFETRDVAGERTRFDNAHADLQRLMKNEAKFDIDLDGFHSFIARMVAEETAIFDRLASFGRDERADNQWQTRLEKRFLRQICGRKSWFDVIPHPRVRELAGAAPSAPSPSASARFG